MKCNGFLKRIVGTAKLNGIINTIHMGMKPMYQKKINWNNKHKNIVKVNMINYCSLYNHVIYIRICKTFNKEQNKRKRHAALKPKGVLRRKNSSKSLITWKSIWIRFTVLMKIMHA